MNSLDKDKTIPQESYIIMEILIHGESVFILKQNPERIYISQIDNKAYIHILIVILSVL